LFNCDTNKPKPQPANTSGITKYHPESARGTIGNSPATPIVASTNPMRMILLGRRLPALLPANSAIPNMLSDSGANDNPACSALYSKTICR
jgi:hypothetical protein